MAESTTFVVLEGDTNRTTDEKLHRLAGAFVANYRSPNTRDAYSKDLRAWLTWCRASDVDPLVGIRRTHVEVYARQMEDRGLAPSTRQRRIGTVRGWYEWLLDEELWDGRNPTRKVSQPTVTPVTERAVLTRREMRILMDAAEAHSPPAHAFVALGYLNGLRMDEMVGADVDDLGSVGYHTTLRIRGKGEKHDEVPLPPPAAAAVKRAVGDRTTGPLITGVSVRGEALPGRIQRRQVGRVLERLCRDTGITRLTPHGLRRTAITLALQERIPLREVQLFARHANSKTTEGYDLRARSMDEHIGSSLIRAIA